MEQLHCPHCQSSEIEQEIRLMASDQSASVGRWRLKYGLISFSAAVLFGLLCVVASWRWLEPPMDEPAVIIAALSFIFAIFVLATTLYYARWASTIQYQCRVCHLTWIDSDDYQDEVNAQVT